MKLELKHLAGYLPYVLKAEFADYDDIEDIEILTILSLEIGSEEDFIVNQYSSFFFQFKPILRPLSDLTKEIEVNGEKFVPKDWLNYNFIGENMGLNIATWSHRTIEKLYEWHFDIHGLIENGLAIDINTINL